MQEERESSEQDSVVDSRRNLLSISIILVGLLISVASFGLMGAGGDAELQPTDSTPGAAQTTAPSIQAPSSSSLESSEASPAVEPGSLSSGSAVGPIVVSKETDVILEDLTVSNPDGVCIRVVGSSNVTIRNSSIGPCGDWAVSIDDSSGVTVEHSTIRTWSEKGGVYGHTSSSIAVVGNTIFDSGRNPIQFDKVDGPGNRIDANSIYDNAAEDMISVYQSSGTPESRLSVADNSIRNNTGRSDTGSGILVGDAGGSYIVVTDNDLLDPGQAGIGVAGGSEITVRNNTVVSEQYPWSNVGIYVWDQYDSNCRNIDVRGNNVHWINKGGEANPSYDGGGCGAIAGWDENSW